MLKIPLTANNIICRDLLISRMYLIFWNIYKINRKIVLTNWDLKSYYLIKFLEFDKEGLTTKSDISI